MQIFQPVLYVSLTPECIMTVVGPRHCASSALWVSNPVPFILDSGSQFIRDIYFQSLSGALYHGSSLTLFIYLFCFLHCTFVDSSSARSAPSHRPTFHQPFPSFFLFLYAHVSLFLFSFLFHLLSFWMGFLNEADLSFFTAINLSISRATSYFCLPKWKKQVKLVCNSRANSV